MSNLAGFANGLISNQALTPAPGSTMAEYIPPAAPAQQPAVPPGQPDYAAMAAQNAAMVQEPIGPAESGAPTGPLNYTAFQTSVLGNSPVAVDPRFDDLYRQSQALGRQQEKNDVQDLQALGAASANQARAADNVASAEVAKAEAEIPGKALLAQRAEEYEGEVRRINDRARFETDEQVRRVRVAADAAQSFQFHDFWASRNTAGKIMGVLAQALGGALNGITNQPGQPTMLDHIIARDWQQQQDQFNALNQKVATERTLLGDLRQSLKDRNDQAMAFYSASIDKIKTQIDVAVAKSNSPVVRANAEAAKAALDEKLAERMQKYDQQSYDNKNHALSTQADILTKRQSLVNEMTRIHLGAEQKAQKADNNLPPEGANVGGIDISNLRLPPKQRQTVTERISAINTVLHEVEEYEANPSLDPSVNQARIAAIKNLIPKASGLTGSGLSEYVQKLEATRIPGKYEVVAGKAYPSNKTKFDILKKDLHRFMGDVVNTYQLTPLPDSPWATQSAEATAPQKLTAEQMRAMVKARK